MATIQGRSPSTGRAIDVAVNAAGSVIIGSDALAVDTRVATFNAAADMPTDAGNATLVAADIWKNTTFSSTARRVVAKFHQGPTSATAGENPICLACRLTINADDDTAAATRLTIADATGNTTTTSGKVDTFMVSASNPTLDISTSVAIDRIDAIGVPTTGNTATAIIPTWLEIQVLG